MGCDIHAHVEIKIRGKWEHWSTPNVDRNYALFGKLAGVRDCTVEPIVKPRGLPGDLSTVTAFDGLLWREDAHSHSWITAKEYDEVLDWYRELVPGNRGINPVFGYLFGNLIDSHIRYPEDAARLRELGFEDARVVFWFDN